MKALRNLSLLAGASCLFGVAAIAGPATKGNLKIYEPVTVQGKQLAPGDYTLQWSGQGPNVEVSIAQGKQQIVSVPAQVVPVAQKAATDGYTAKKEQDGTNALTEIFFQNRSYEIRFGEQAASTPSAAAPSGSNQ